MSSPYSIPYLNTIRLRTMRAVRTGRLTLARRVVVHLARRRLAMSYPQIALALGYLGHNSAIYAYQRTDPTTLYYVGEADALLERRKAAAQNTAATTGNQT